LTFTNPWSTVSAHGGREATLRTRRTAAGRFRKWSAACAALVLAALLPAAGAGGDPQGLVVTRFPVPVGIPTSITAGPDGALWFVTTETRTVGRITTEGAITQYPIPRTTDFDSLGEITAGSDGSLWVADCASIWRVGTDGTTTAFPTTAGTCVHALTNGPDGAVWFTGYEDNVTHSHLGRIAPDGAITEFADVHDGLIAETLTTGPDGALWFTEAGYGIGRMTTAGVMTTFALPKDPPAVAGCPRSITTGADGALWFPLVCQGTIGRLTAADPASAGSFTQFPASDPLRSAYGIVSAADGALWYVLNSGDLGRMALDGTTITVPTNNFGSQGADTGIAVGSDGNIWFTAADEPFHFPRTGFVARVRASVDGEVDNDASATLEEGGTLSTNSTTTQEDPIGTSVTSPGGGTVSIQELPLTADQHPPMGYVLLGQHVEITAPDATPENPLVFEFRLDESLIPDGRPDAVYVLRNATMVADCPVAAPDPCVLSRIVGADGDLVITVRTPHASDWTFAADTTAPTIACAAADGAWHATNVTIACTASDAGSGLASTADASFTLSTSVAAGTETANAPTGTRSVCDKAGQCAMAGPVTGNKVDRKGPSVSLRVPRDGGRYAVLSRHTVDYDCTEGGSGTASCKGTQADGASLPTGVLSLGGHSFRVTATDRVGNSTVVTHQYTVSVLALLR
jgi:virginiamycin B lyase